MGILLSKFSIAHNVNISHSHEYLEYYYSEKV